MKETITAFVSAVLLATSLLGTSAAAQNVNGAKRAQVIDYWTAERRAAATPRDMVIDHRGLGYLRRADGSLQPYGHQISASQKSSQRPTAKPAGAGGKDSEPPQISGLDPSADSTIGSSHTFAATVTDNVGVRSVTFIVTSAGGAPQNFSASNSGGNTWSTTLSGFTDGDWTWQVEAKDTAKRGGNTAMSAETPFKVLVGGNNGGDDTITNERWTAGGDVQKTVGRLFYEMPSNPRLKRWSGYVCSGTVVTDEVTARSVILTASHCVYDDSNKAFARNVLFIPDQAGTRGNGTDSNCSNDPVGCWVASFGVVDVNWTTSVFPDNIPWDYAFYVVDDDQSSHSAGYTASSSTLDAAVPPLSIQFTPPVFDDSGTSDFTHGMGYSYSDDPNFMYCAEDMTTEGAANWWLPSCGLSGGSSGGPWVQPLNGGTGPIISVNSWGYTGSPGMAGPKLSGTSASCVYNAAALRAFPDSPADGDAGYAIDCP